MSDTHHTEQWARMRGREGSARGLLTLQAKAKKRFCRMCHIVARLNLRAQVIVCTSSFTNLRPRFLYYLRAAVAVLVTVHVPLVALSRQTIR